MTQEYIIYCDESEQTGKHFSNFYGGALIRSGHIDEVRETLALKKAELNFHGEVKWTKITAGYEQKYKDLVDAFFGMVAADKIKIRIMFTKNTVVPVNLTSRHIEDKYFILYYQFLKLGFGLQYSPAIVGGTRLRIYPDKLPDTDEKVAQFKSFLASLSHNAEFRRLRIAIRPEDIAEVNSHHHDILQCLDIVLGSIHFRLNDKHKEIPAGKRRRGKRTVAKEAVYKHINDRIREIYPGFNVGISTGHQGDERNRWNHSYRHWLFMPTNRIVLPGSKNTKRGGPKEEAPSLLHKYPK